MNQTDNEKEQLIRQALELLKKEREDYDHVLELVGVLKSDQTVDEIHLKSLLGLLQSDELRKLRDIKNLIHGEQLIEKIRQRYETLQYKIRDLYEQMFGVREVLTPGGAITHATSDFTRSHYNQRGRDRLIRFAQLSGIDPNNYDDIFNELRKDWGRVARKANMFLEKWMKYPLHELEDYYNELQRVRNNPKYAFIFKYKTWYDFCKAMDE